MHDIMVDLETLGTKADSVILSIGAVRFNKDTDEIGDQFYQRISISSSLRAGMTITGGTFLWWLEQEDAARKAIYSETGAPLDVVLTSFAKFLKDKDFIWGNGAAFDNTILATAYDKAGLIAPWGHSKDRCLRTMRALAPEVERPETGVAHHALDDALNQARQLQAIMKRLRGK